jgi:hypothetical protein
VIIRRSTGPRIQTVEREPPIRENLSVEAEEYLFLEAITSNY